MFACAASCALSPQFLASEANLICTGDSLAGLADCKRPSYGLCAKIISCNRNLGRNRPFSSLDSFDTPHPIPPPRPAPFLRRSLPRTHQGRAHNFFPTASVQDVHVLGDVVRALLHLFQDPPRVLTRLRLPIHQRKRAREVNESSAGSAVDLAESSRRNIPRRVSPTGPS